MFNKYYPNGNQSTSRINHLKFIKTVPQNPTEVTLLLNSYNSKKWKGISSDRTSSKITEIRKMVQIQKKMFLIPPPEIPPPEIPPPEIPPPEIPPPETIYNYKHSLYTFADVKNSYYKNIYTDEYDLIETNSKELYLKEFDAKEFLFPTPIFKIEEYNSIVDFVLPHKNIYSTEFSMFAFIDSDPSKTEPNHFSFKILNNNDENDEFLHLHISSSVYTLSITPRNKNFEPVNKQIFTGSSNPPFISNMGAEIGITIDTLGNVSLYVLGVLQINFSVGNLNFNFFDENAYWKLSLLKTTCGPIGTYSKCLTPGEYKHVVDYLNLPLSSDPMLHYTYKNSFYNFVDINNSFFKNRYLNKYDLKESNSKEIQLEMSQAVFSLPLKNYMINCLPFTTNYEFILPHKIGFSTEFSMFAYITATDYFPEENRYFIFSIYNKNNPNEVYLKLDITNGKIKIIFTPNDNTGNQIIYDLDFYNWELLALPLTGILEIGVTVDSIGNIYIYNGGNFKKWIKDEKLKFNFFGKDVIWKLSLLNTKFGPIGTYSKCLSHGEYKQIVNAPG